MKSRTNLAKPKVSLANEWARQKRQAEISSIVDRQIQSAISRNVPLHMALIFATRQIQLLMQSAEDHGTQTFPTYQEFVARADKIAKLYQAAGHDVRYPTPHLYPGSINTLKKTTIGVHQVGMPSLVTDGENCFGRVYLTVAIQCASREILAYDVSTKPSYETWLRTIGNISSDSWQSAVSNINSTNEKRLRIALSKDGKDLALAPMTQGHADKALHSLALVAMAATNPAANAGEGPSAFTPPTLRSVMEMTANWVETHNRIQRAVLSIWQDTPTSVVTDNHTEFADLKAHAFIH